MFIPPLGLFCRLHGMLMINCFSLARHQLCGGLGIDFQVVLAAALSLYISVIHKAPVTWAEDHHPFVLTWLSSPIIPVNTFAFGGVGEAARGNKTCKLIKLLGLVA